MFSDVELEFDHLGVVTVGDVLADPDRFVDGTLADPLEGIDYGRSKAIVMKNDHDTLLIHSFAHGRGIYFLRHDLRSAKAAFAQAPDEGKVDFALAILGQAELEEDEFEEFVTLVSKAAGVGIRSLKARIKKGREERKAEARKASMEAEAKADGRIVRVRPEADGELLPTVTFLDDVLVADQSGEPPMRNASGALVQIEALLPERPAFFVVAGQRGGGKTTLVHMFMKAVFGRAAAAASWSDNAEERKKALFSYLRQGVAALCWDIARGSTLSCPHIEAALTASEVSDRVLGVSCVETVPATTVQIFTGNSIAPRGDMASRSFIVSLNVDRPDPENRTFTHADPLAWTQANRTKILRALYTILIGGTRNRPQAQVAKTRFKTWWGLIGWPVEYAADLAGLKVDCTELLRAGKAGEEEASATSRALATLKKKWGTKPFTARAVVQELAKADNTLLHGAEEAEELADALGELIGKVLEKPTARSIGKLFQKHLTNRPAFIEDGNCVAVLRKKSGDRANEYEIEIPGGEAEPWRATL